MDQVKTYVNGILYALLSDKTIREHACALGIGDILSMHKNNADESFIAQIDHVLEKLSSEEYVVTDDVSEDGDDLDDTDDCVGFLCDGTGSFMIMV